MTETTMKVLRSASNPVTRSTVRLEPGFSYHSNRELEAFLGQFADYCTAAWDREYRQDPTVVSSVDVMLGVQPPEGLTEVHEALRPMIAKYGQFAVMAALRDLAPGAMTAYARSPREALGLPEEDS